ncbi:MAG: Fur family transcriptional regulator [Candidatus Riflebacteria bacterium]
MKAKKTIIDRRIQDFIALCRENQVKVTPQRLAVYKEILDSTDHPDAEKLLARLRKSFPSISLDTVYRTLWLLNDFGLISTLGLTREKTRFEANLEFHHHFVCVECGSTSDFFSDTLNAVDLPADVEKMGEVRNTHVEVRGICNTCLKKRKTGKKS